MNSSMSLEQLQRSMAAAVMLPLTPNEQMQQHSPSGRPMAEVASEFIRPNRQLTAFERLEIYNRQYWFRLQSSFTEDFPGLRAVVGPARFEALMNAYIAAHPSRSYTLRNLGSHLLSWLQQNPACAGSRIALALDVVRVEWACIEAFDNAELPPLGTAEVATIGEDSRLALQPHIQLLALAYPADDFVLDLHQKQKRESTEAGTKEESQTAPAKSLRLRKQPIWLAIHRADHSLYYRRLSSPEYRTLVALQQQLTLPEAIENAFRDSHLPVARQASLLQEWFANWAAMGWLCQAPAQPAPKG